MTAERWLPAVGYEGMYDVSDHGRVRSWATYNRPQVPAFLTPYLSKQTGYYYVKLQVDGNAANPTLHKLITSAFFGPRPEGLVVRHLDGDPTNNSLDNLRYGTPSENNFDTVRHGRSKEANQTECKRGHAFTTENTRLETRPGGRVARRCLTCQRDYDRARRAVAA